MPTFDAHTPFIALWRLDTTQSDYQFGAPPRSATYQIEREGTGLRFTANWVAADGRIHHMSFFGVPDGVDHPYENPAIADSIVTTAVNTRTLDTVTKKDGKEIARARRVLSNDRSEMKVTQSGVMPDGKKFRNIAVYRRT